MVMSFCIIITKGSNKTLETTPLSLLPLPPPPKSCPICYVWTRWHALSECSVSWRHGTIFSSNISKGVADGWEGGLSIEPILIMLLRRVMVVMYSSLLRAHTPNETLRSGLHVKKKGK